MNRAKRCDGTTKDLNHGVSTGIHPGIVHLGLIPLCRQPRRRVQDVDAVALGWRRAAGRQGPTQTEPGAGIEVLGGVHEPPGLLGEEGSSDA